MDMALCYMTPTLCVCSIDQVLQGGFHCREITEIFGPSLSGKTQVCHAVGPCLCCGLVYFMSSSV